MTKFVSSLCRLGFLSLTLACAASVALTSGALAAGDDVATEDVVYMSDGRVFHCQILNESRHSIVIEYTDPTIKSTAKITLLRLDIAKIEEDVELESPAVAAAAEDEAADASVDEGELAETDEPAETAAPTEREELERHLPGRTRYGAHETDVDDESVTDIYIIPMRGTMGTDICEKVYLDMVEDIKSHDPDLLVIKLESSFREDKLYPVDNPLERGQADMEEYQDMVKVFQDKLREYRQVLWIHDSFGVSSIPAMAWEEIYMTPRARLGGGSIFRQMTGFDAWPDEDVRGKMTAAFMAMATGFFERGERSANLATALIRPEYTLSARFEGREVEWLLNEQGDYIVDDDDEKAVSFYAKDAEDLCISQGTAETLDDLALLLGVREYRIVEGDAEEIFEDHVEDWRRSLDNCVTWLADAEQYLGWASGDDELKYLGRVKSNYENVLKAMDIFPPLEGRVPQQTNYSRAYLEQQIVILKERIRALKENGRTRGGGGGQQAPGGMGSR